jgi:hypothetical protein
MQTEIFNDLKGFNWQTIIDFGSGLDDLNDSQWRFLKGLVIELLVEEHGENSLKYVGDKHKDYVWPKHNVDVELKSQMSGSMYLKKGQLQKRYGIKLNNSMGTNKKSTLDPSDVADVLIVVRDDGAFAIDKQTILANAKAGGDGFEVSVTSDQIVELSGKVHRQTNYNPNLKEAIIEAVRSAIPKKTVDKVAA